MDWEAWSPWYEAILEDMGYDRAADEAARDDLVDLLSDRDTVTPAQLWDRFEGAPTIVVGAGPGLPDLEAGDLPPESEAVVVACDPAAGRLLELDRVPDVVVTDLDGDPWALAEAADEGALPVVHAHGDNRGALRDVVPELPDELHGTTQARPRPPVHCWGGFTDGDRAALLADHFGARRIRLVAFDLDAVGPGPTGDREEKARKLAWARRLLGAVEAPLEGGDVEAGFSPR
jgi:uncharacterized Rossmann fold enzyme